MARALGSKRFFRNFTHVLKSLSTLPTTSQNEKQKIASSQKKLNFPHQEIVDVAFFTEGTYPYIRGGVSTVIHQIIEAHPNLSFGITFIGWDKNSKLELKYVLPKNVKWVKTIFLNDDLKADSQYFNFFKTNLNNEKLAKDFFQALNDLKNNQSHSFEKIYFKYLNPQTRTSNLRNIFHSDEFLDMLFLKFADQDMTLNDLYWLQKELGNVFYQLTEMEYPKAKVYHSHTQGYAGFAASLAALQNQGSFFLTEHSLYLRDVKQYIAIDVARRKKLSKTAVEKSAIEIKKRAWEVWFEMTGKWTYNQASKVSYLYEKIALEAEGLGSPLQKSQIIPNGIDPVAFQEAIEKQALRHEKRKNKNHLWVISLVGRIVPVKGILDMIETAKILKETSSQKFIVELVGPFDEDISYYEECVKKVNEFNLQAEVKFLGPKKVTEYLGQTDLMVLSSHSEALPMAALEAMASTIPVVSTDVGSVRDIIQKEIGEDKIGACGLVSNVQDPKDLAAKILETIGNLEIYEKFKINAPKRVNANYVLSDVMKKYEMTYIELALDNAKIQLRTP